MIRVFVIDKSPVIQHGLISIPGTNEHLQVIGQASNLGEALPVILDLNPDVIIIDAFGPSGGGGHNISMIRGNLPNAKVLVLTDSKDEHDFLEALKTGAKGYLLKSSAISELLDAIYIIASGELVVNTFSLVRNTRLYGKEAN